MYNITVLSLIISGAIIILTMIIKHNLKNQLTQEIAIEPPISKKNKKRGVTSSKPPKDRKFWRDSDVWDSIQQVLLVFFGAMLALGLTNYSDHIHEINLSAAQLDALYHINVQELSDIHMCIKDTYEQNKDHKELSDTDIEKLIKEIVLLSGESDSIQYSDSTLNNVDSFSILLLDITNRNKNTTVAQLRDQDGKSLNKEKLSDDLCGYIFWLAKLSYLTGILRLDPSYSLGNIVQFDESTLADNTEYEIYKYDVAMLSEMLSISLEDWEKKTFN